MHEVKCRNDRVKQREFAMQRNDSAPSAVKRKRQTSMRVHSTRAFRVARTRKAGVELLKDPQGASERAQSETKDELEARLSRH